MASGSEVTDIADDDLEFPMDHQSLFCSYLDAQRSINGEFSGAIEEANQNLMAWAVVYSAKHGLFIPKEEE